MPPQLINVKGQTLLLINKKNDNSLYYEDLSITPVLELLGDL